MIKEYPKMLYNLEGKHKIAADAEAETALNEQGFGDAEFLSGDDDKTPELDRDAIKAALKNAGIEFDGRASTETLNDLLQSNAE